MADYDAPIRLDPALHAYAQRLAEQRAVTLSEVINELLRTERDRGLAADVIWRSKVDEGASDPQRARRADRIAASIASQVDAFSQRRSA